MRKMNCLRSHLHEIYSERINKIALSANDDKRVILEDELQQEPMGIGEIKNKKLKPPMFFLHVFPGDK